MPKDSQPDNKKKRMEKCNGHPPLHRKIKTKTATQRKNLLKIMMYSIKGE